MNKIVKILNQKVIPLNIIKRRKIRQRLMKWTKQIINKNRKSIRKRKRRLNGNKRGSPDHLLMLLCSSYVTLNFKLWRLNLNWLHLKFLLMLLACGMNFLKKINKNIGLNIVKIELNTMNSLNNIIIKGRS